MSRTDVHRPFWVQTQDPTMRRHLQAWHDHWIRTDWSDEQRRHLVAVTGPCTINDPDSLRCRWWPSGRNNLFCGCLMCTGRHGRICGRRHERTQLRTDIRAALARARAAAGDDDITIDPPGRPQKW